MSDHEIVWEFDRDGVYQKLVCNNDDCKYRYVCQQNCEVMTAVEKTEDGYRHLAYDQEDGIDADVWHPMPKVSYCNFCEWLNNSDILPELTSTPDQFEIGRTPVDPVWLGEDGVEWKRVLS